MNHTLDSLNFKIMYIYTFYNQYSKLYIIQIIPALSI